VPVVVVQEGGYRVRTLGVNARNFFTGLATAVARTPPQQPRPVPATTALAAPAPVLEYRESVAHGDIEAIRRLVVAAGVFNAEEIPIAGELVHERIERGSASGYEFVLAEHSGELVAYACYGPIAGTQNRYDLYWIAVHPKAQRNGTGARLMEKVEARVREAGGQRMYIDTSSATHYAAARGFYARVGYQIAAELPDFYAPGDGKVIFVKTLVG